MVEKTKKIFMLVFFGHGDSSQVLRYLVAGGSAFVADIAVLYFLKGVLGWPLLLSVALSFVAGFSISFVAQKYWTFSDNTSDRIHKQAGAHFGLTIANFFTQLLMMHFLVTVLGVWYILAKVFTSGSIASVSFFIYKHAIFKKRREEEKVETPRLQP